MKAPVAGWVLTVWYQSVMVSPSSIDSQVTPPLALRIMMRSANGGVTWESIEEGDTITDWYQTVKTHPATGAFIAVGHSGKVIQIGG